MVIWMTPVMDTTSGIMVIKTLSDCSHCQYLTVCDAHISNGTHKNSKKSDPCELDLNPLKTNQ